MEHLLGNKKTKHITVIVNDDIQFDIDITGTYAVSIKNDAMSVVIYTWHLYSSIFIFISLLASTVNLSVSICLMTTL